MSIKNIPIQEIAFTAKTGFLSWDVWTKFFSRRSQSRNSRVWNGFIRDRYFKPHASKLLPRVLILDEAGKLLLEKLGHQKPVQPVGLNQFDHDEKVSRIVLGLSEKKHLTNFITEAQLKKNYEDWKGFIGGQKKLKFSDVILEFQGPKKVLRVALEVEQSRKTTFRYRQMMNSYASIKDIDLVIFLSDQKTIFNSLGKAMKDVVFPTWERPVAYGKLQDWIEFSNDAPLYLASRQTTLWDWLDEKSQ